jgi:hypothetical protein
LIAAEISETEYSATLWAGEVVGVDKWVALLLLCALPPWNIGIFGSIGKTGAIRKASRFHPAGFVVRN